MAYRANPDKNRNKVLAIVAAAVLVVALGIIAYRQSTGQHKTTGSSPSPTPSVNYSPATSADNSTTEQSKNQPPVTPTPAGATPTAGNIGVQITGANVNSGNVHIGTLVSNTTAGNCILTASKAGQSTQQLGTSTVRFNVNEYDCGVYNIPTSAFPASGTWQLQLSVTNGQNNGVGNYDVTIP